MCPGLFGLPRWYELKRFVLPFDAMATSGVGERIIDAIVGHGDATLSVGGADLRIPWLPMFCWYCVRIHSAGVPSRHGCLSSRRVNGYAFRSLLHHLARGLNTPSAE